MLPPGTPTGPLGLPVSYTKYQLFDFGWDEKRRVFINAPSGPRGSRLNDGRYQGQAPRNTRKPSHYNPGTIH